MTDLASGFLDLDDLDVDMRMFAVSDDDAMASSETWQLESNNVDWDWASKAMSPVIESMPMTNSGFLNCWRDGPAPEPFRLNDDPSTTTSGGRQRGQGDSGSDDDLSSDLQSKRDNNSSLSSVSTNRRWTSAEFQALVEGVAEYGTGNWRAIMEDVRWKPLLGDRLRSSLHRKWSRYLAKTSSHKHQPVSNPVSGEDNEIPSTRILAQAVAQAVGQGPGPSSDTIPSSFKSVQFRVGSWEPTSSLFDETPPSAPIACSVPIPHSMPFTWTNGHINSTTDNVSPPRRPPLSASRESSSSVPIPIMHHRHQAHKVQLAVCVDPLSGNGRAPSPNPTVASCPTSGSSPFIRAPSGFPIGSFNHLNQPAINSRLMPGMPPPSPSNGSLLSPDSAAAPLSAGTSGRPKRWTPAEAQSLAQAVSIHGESRWREILLDEKFAAFFAGRSPQSLVRKWGRMSSRSPSIGAPSVHRPAESAAIPVNIDQTRYSDSSLGVSTSLPAHLRSYPY